MEILVGEQFKRVGGGLVADDFAVFGGFAFVDRRVERGRALRGLLEHGDFLARQAELGGEFIVGRLAAEGFGETGGNPAHAGDFVHHVDWQADRFGLVGERALDRLLDPPGAVGRELAAFFRVEALDGVHQADIALGNEVAQGKPVAGIVVGDFHHQPEVRLDHVGAGLVITSFDPLGEGVFLLDGEKRCPRDFPQIEFHAAVGVVGHGHVSVET